MSDSSKIDGHSLVLADKTALPMRCIKTNEPVDEDHYSSWSLPYIPQSLAIAMILCPFLMIAAPFSIRRRCRIRAGLSAKLNRKYLYYKLAAASLIVGSFVIPVLATVSESQTLMPISVLLFPFMFWGGFAVLILCTAPLKIVQCQGDQYWIQGCSNKFLASLKE